MPNEKIIQMVANERDLYVLTNQGRIFYDERDGNWAEVRLPDLKKPKPRAQAKESGYSSEFLGLWASYPKGHGGNKQDANTQYLARIKESSDGELEYQKMRQGVANYARYVKETGQHVKHPATFFGKFRHYRNDYTIPESVTKKNELKLPYQNEDLEAFAVKHNLPMAGAGVQFPAWRKRLQIEVDKINNR